MCPDMCAVCVCGMTEHSVVGHPDCLWCAGVQASTIKWERNLCRGLVDDMPEVGGIADGL
jgi:hypothetical protein